MTSLWDRWDTETDPKKRSALYDTLTLRHDPPMFPRFSNVDSSIFAYQESAKQQGGMREKEELDEKEGAAFSDYAEGQFGLYPDLDDPRFHEKLFHKLEFAENKQMSIAQLKEKADTICNPNAEFELSPVQRFVSRYLSAQCPYQSALLYHGVGVGKTCAAISIAESYLHIFPNKKVIIVAPPNIQPNFRRTIFDIDSVKISDDENTPNTLKGCTADYYLRRTGTEFEKEKSVIASRVRDFINARYEFMGYIQFQRYIERVKAEDRSDMARALRMEFEGRLVIIDEAHNLRDVPGETADDNIDSAGGDEEVADATAGKKLSPTLSELLEVVHGMKLVLMTATPMYNNYREIIFLLNLLLKNDKRVELTESDIFKPNGDFQERGEEMLGNAAAAYISFMRGENPLSFPVRLTPESLKDGRPVPKMVRWPEFNPKGDATGNTSYVIKLPLVPVSYEGASLEAYASISNLANLSVSSIDTMVQSGNWLYPVEGVTPEGRIRDAGFDACFRQSSGGSIQFTATQEDLGWMTRDGLGAVSPKAKFILDALQGAKGVSFVYSRFIKSGALPLVLILEANGYTPYGRDSPMLKNGPQAPGGRQCAKCSRKEQEHKGAGHVFKPAKYILLTGRATLSPNNAAMVAAARSDANKDGAVVKVIVGSQVASEGIDLRFVREIYVFDSWFHLNKMEQVLGRGVRTCSHALLDKKERNTTIYLLVNVLPEEDTETADLYMYRTAMNKAIQMGKVSRVLKRYALDCNLNIDAILIPPGTLDTETQEDAQGLSREVEFNDTEFTAICDWIDTCTYECAKKMEKPINVLTADRSTYDEFSAKWHESELRNAVRKIFQVNEQPAFRFNEIRDMMSAIPTSALRGLLSEIVGNQSFRLKIGRKEGYIVFRNGYYLFQPFGPLDTNIPLSLRIQDYPVKRDSFEPIVEKIQRTEELTYGIWPVMVQLAAVIREGGDPAEAFAAVNAGLAERYTNPSELTKEQQHIYGVLWFYQTMRENELWRKTLADAFLGLVWDEILRPLEQMKLIQDETARRIGSEQILRKGSIEAFRYIDGQSGELRYMCGSKQCDMSVAKIFNEDPADPLNSLQANTETAGIVYGFLVPNLKSGYLSFKTTDKVAAPGKVPPKGGECEIVTQISFHYTALAGIGRLLVAAGLPPFGLTMADFQGDRKFQNSSRACSLINVILRWMNLAKVGGKLWYFRPVAAYKSKHQVLANKPKKVRAKKGAAAEAPKAKEDM